MPQIPHYAAFFGCHGPHAGANFYQTMNVLHNSEAEVYGGLGIIRVSPSEFCNVELRAGKRRDAIKTTDPNITPTNNSEQQTHAEEDSSQ